MNPLVVFPFTAAVLIASLGVSVLVRKLRREPSQLFAVFCASLSAWTLGGFSLSHQITEQRALYWAGVLQYGMILAPVFFLHMVVSLFGLGRRSLLIPAYLAATFLIVANNFGLLVQGVERVQYTSNIAQWYAVGGPLRALLVLYALVVTISVMTVLWSVATSSGGRRRAEARYLLLAVGLAFAGGIHDYFGLLGVQSYPRTSVPLYPIGSFALVIWAAIPAYTLHRSRLVDIDVAVARTLASALVLVVLLMTGFSGLIAAQRAYFGEVDPEFSLIALGVFLSATFLFPRLRVVARESIENVLFASDKDYQSALYALSRESTHMVDLDRLLDLLCETLTYTHGAESASVYVDNGKQIYRLGAWRGGNAPTVTVLEVEHPVLALLADRAEPLVRDELELEASRRDPELLSVIARLEELGAAVALPLVMGDRFVGLILLGEKDDASAYSSDDLQRLSILSNHLAVAVLNARLYTDLTRSQEIIQQSDRLSAIGTMAAVLAHEIRNPLVSIRTFTQLLPERYLDEEFRSTFLELTLSEVDRISGLINELLTFARPAPAELRALDINDSVEKISRLLGTQAKNKAVLLRLELGDGLPQVTADEDQIKQVIMNVVMNAIESCTEDGVVSVSSDTCFRSGTEYVRILVRDNGCGIDEKNLKQIFEPFFTTRRDGTGLGLAIAQQIVTKHGGIISIETTVGRGTCFFVHLPVEAPPMTARMSRLEPPEPGIHG